MEESIQPQIIFEDRAWNDLPYFMGNVTYPMSAYDKAHLHAFLSCHKFFWQGRDPKTQKPIRHMVQRSSKPITHGTIETPAEA